VTETTNYYGTGRRKESVARVWLKEGGGEFLVNGKSLDDYFKRETLKMVVRQPLEATNTGKRFSIFATIQGGGVSGQAGALRHGIARALLAVDESLRSVLRRSGFLTRDPRAKERKKYGRKGARRRFQYTKR
jgi:small subunit ribosomal protein S9